MAASISLENDTKYDVVESELHYINSKFISLNAEERKETNAFFYKFIPSFVNRMQDVDILFDSMFQSILYAGSYYEGLKIGKPDEYDLDLIFKLPINYDALEITSSPEKPGYVRIRISDLEHRRLLKDQYWSERYKVMANWFDENKFFIPDKFRYWLQSVVQKTINRYTYDSDQWICYSTSGPAITLHVEKDDIEFSVDLVPVLQMQNRCPPSEICNIRKSKFLEEDFYEENSEEEDSVENKMLSWYVVPKPIKSGSNNTSGANLNWRLAFHDHEKKLISGNERLKPALRLLKKFRDSQNFAKIASYYLKTICLWELKKAKNKRLWTSGSLSKVFVHILKAFSEAIEICEIQYYWQKEHNLLSDINRSTIVDMGYRLNKIINKIELDPTIIPQFILSKEEYQRCKCENVYFSESRIQPYSPITSISSSYRPSSPIRSTYSSIQPIVVQSETQSETQSQIPGWGQIALGLGLGLGAVGALVLLNRNRNRNN
ncbi:cyclic GMP-AMP synthase-like [Chrysoperla carnea]|uniref:cyclic GMP-AMP synthase-like n=1 Tax=Chrysoperla carnea TaxID=189513 RepID=UPI001D07C3E6|nr:cyclic GMP-AMP synthase-like [Chrysoperla carnea]